MIVRSDQMIHVCNVPSPAATASLVIGEQIAQMAAANDYFRSFEYMVTSKRATLTGLCFEIFHPNFVYTGRKDDCVDIVGQTHLYHSCTLTTPGILFRPVFGDEKRSRTLA